MIEQIKKIEEKLKTISSEKIQEVIEIYCPIKVGTIIKSQLELNGKVTTIFSKVKEIRFRDGQLEARYAVLEINGNKINFVEEMLFSSLELIEEDAIIASDDQWNTLISAFAVMTSAQKEEIKEGN